MIRLASTFRADLLALAEEARGRCVNSGMVTSSGTLVAGPLTVVAYCRWQNGRHGRPVKVVRFSIQRDGVWRAAGFNAVIGAARKAGIGEVG